MKLNLGCGNLPLDGYINIDRSFTAKADMRLDITNGIPALDGEAEEIHAGCVLEQLTNDQFMFVLNDCHRALKEGGKLHGYVPSTDPRVLFLDPNDRLFFQQGTFDYFNKNKHQWREFGKNYGYAGWSSTNTYINESGILFFAMLK